MMPAAPRKDNKSSLAAYFSNGPTNYIYVLILSNVLVFQMAGYFGYYYATTHAPVTVGNRIASQSEPSNLGGSGGGNPLDYSGTAVALPSVRVEDTSVKENVDKTRKYYGGKGDKPHLGGFASNDIDMDGVSPGTWKVMVEKHGIHSILDIGCGRGISTSWFYDHGVDTMCVEGSHDAIMQSVLPQPVTDIVTEHDFSRGPWWPHKTVDAVWCVELLEHVGRNFHKNLMPAFRKAAIVYASHSTWGGWHHVEVHSEAWWIRKFTSFGFVYDAEMTKELRDAARATKNDLAPNEKTYQAQHIYLHLLVFINPQVASLPQHHHLFHSEHGCYGSRAKDGSFIGRICGEGKAVEETPLPEDWYPLKLTPEMDTKWEERVFPKQEGGAPQ